MLNNSASTSYTATSISSSLPVKRMHGASLTEADRENMRSQMKPLPLYSDIGDNLPDLHPSHHDNSFIRRHNVYIYSPNNSRVNLSSHSEFEYCQCFMHTTDKPDYVEARLFMRQRWATNTNRQTNTKSEILILNHVSFLEISDLKNKALFQFYCVTANLQFPSRPTWNSCDFSFSLRWQQFINTKTHSSKG